MNENKFKLFLFLIVLILFFTAGISIYNKAQTAGQPNILLITLDTTRADHLPCYGYSFPTMPFLCNLATTKGTIYDRAFTTAPLTFPAHTSLFTGMEPQRHLMLDNGLFRFGKDKETLATILKKNGYSTYAYISAAILDRSYGLNSGFDLYDDNVRMGKREYFNFKERAASQVLDSILNSVDSWKKPYFAWIHFYDPHDPYLPPSPYDQQFKNPYDGELAFVDAQMKRLFDALKNKNKWQSKTDWACILGDHGEDLGDFNELRHGILITPSTIKIPFIILSPDASGKHINNIVSISDVAPTILNLLNLWNEQYKNKMDGKPVSSSPEKHAPITIATMMPFFSFRWSPLIAELDYPYMLIKGSRNELFNIDKDPMMKSNLNDKEKQIFISLNRSLEKIKRKLTEKMNPDQKNIENREALYSLGYAGTMSSNMPKEPFILPDARDRVYVYKETLESKHLIIEQKWNEALEKYSSLIKADPSNTMVLGNLATIYENLGDTKKTENILLHVKELLPDMDFPYQHLGEFYMRQNRLEEAEKYLKIGLQKNKRDADMYNDLFQIAFNQKNVNAAFDILKQAETNGVKDIELAVFLSILSRNKGLWQEALNALKTAEELDPNDERIFIEKANILCKPASPLNDKCPSLLQNMTPDAKQRAEVWADAAEWYASKRTAPAKPLLLD